MSVEPKGQTVVSVRVWGMVANRLFSENALLSDLGRNSATLTGVSKPLPLGEIFGVECGGKKGRCRVSCVDSETMAIELVEGQPCPWESLILPTSNKEVGDDGRKYRRHVLTLPIELQHPEGKGPMRMSATDISGSGCYLQTTTPFNRGSRLKFCFWMGSEKLEGEGTVRTSDPGFGMGFEFTGIMEETKLNLQRWLDKRKHDQSEI